MSSLVALLREMCFYRMLGIMTVSFGTEYQTYVPLRIGPRPQRTYLKTVAVQLAQHWIAQYDR